MSNLFVFLFLSILPEKAHALLRNRAPSSSSTTSSRIRNLRKSSGGGSASNAVGASGNNRPSNLRDRQPRSNSEPKEWRDVEPGGGDSACVMQSTVSESLDAMSRLTLSGPELGTTESSVASMDHGSSSTPEDCQGDPPREQQQQQCQHRRRIGDNWLLQEDPQYSRHRFSRSLEEGLELEISLNGESDKVSIEDKAGSPDQSPPSNSVHDVLQESREQVSRLSQMLGQTDDMLEQLQANLDEATRSDIDRFSNECQTFVSEVSLKVADLSKPVLPQSRGRSKENTDQKSLAAEAMAPLATEEADSEDGEQQFHDCDPPALISVAQPLSEERKQCEPSKSVSAVLRILDEEEGNLSKESSSTSSSDSGSLSGSGFLTASGEAGIQDGEEEDGAMAVYDSNLLKWITPPVTFRPVLHSRQSAAESSSSSTSSPDSNFVSTSTSSSLSSAMSNEESEASSSSSYLAMEDVVSYKHPIYGLDDSIYANRVIPYPTTAAWPRTRPNHETIIKSLSPAVMKRIAKKIGLAPGLLPCLELEAARLQLGLAVFKHTSTECDRGCEGDESETSSDSDSSVSISGPSLTMSGTEEDSLESTPGEDDEDDDSEDDLFLPSVPSRPRFLTSSSSSSSDSELSPRSHEPARLIQLDERIGAMTTFENWFSYESQDEHASTRRYVRENRINEDFERSTDSESSGN